MHGKAGDRHDEPTASTSSSPAKGGRRFSTKKLKGKGASADPMDWGLPGHLTDEEVAIFVSRHWCGDVMVLMAVFDCCRRHVDWGW